MKPLYLHLIAIVLLAVLGHCTAGRVEGAEVKHKDLQEQLNAIQSQLNHLPPTWDQILPVAQRFVLVMGGAAVLDKETGLVWEQSPDTTIRDWFSAQSFCNHRAVGGREGWRLPTVQELASLVDPTQAEPALPVDHPFSLEQSSIAFGFWWSATSVALHVGGIDDAWGVGFGLGGVGADGKTVYHFVWCVRGGHGGPDAQ
jgi:Protein of unknown function (DUF1566)